MLSFQVPFRPDEVHSSGWKLVFLQTNVLFQRIPSFYKILQHVIKLSANSFFAFLNYWKLVVIICNVRKVVIVCCKNTFHQVLAMVCPIFYGAITFSFGCICCKSRHVEHFTVFSMSAFIFIQYMDSLARNLVFSIPVSLQWRLSSVCYCNSAGIMILLPFISITSIIANSSLKMQYDWMPLRNFILVYFYSKGSIFCIWVFWVAYIVVIVIMLPHFLTIAMNGLWSVMILSSLAK